jgi:hypothetical protein
MDEEPTPKPKRVTRRTKIPLADEVRDTCRSLTMMALKSLAEVAATSKNQGARVAASRELLDRGWGKSHTIPGGDISPANRIEVTFGDSTSPTPKDD